MKMSYLDFLARFENLKGELGDFLFDVEFDGIYWLPDQRKVELVDTVERDNLRHEVRSLRQENEKLIRRIDFLERGDYI